ncbi:MAG: H(+)/Cl(-) exchange transporter ClcA [Verrucomicrobiae bacterium]|nr:H(+)/Cl(-) exchange transporter ClcA [Verrucomicrobiae bacterium]
MTSPRPPFFFWRIVLTGLLTGLVGVAFRLGFTWIESCRTQLAHTLQPWGLAGLPILMVLCTGSVVLGVWLVRHFAPEARGSGIPQVKQAVETGSALATANVLWVKFVGGLVAIGGGMTLGREGPTVQMGAVLGDATGKSLKQGSADRLTLICAGAGAGLTTAFNAPLAGIIFVIEELRGKLDRTTFFATFLACVLADSVTRLCLGQSAYFILPAYGAPRMEWLPLFALIGLAGGLFGALFNRCLVWGLDLFQAAAKRFPVYGITALIGVVIGLTLWWNPVVPGGGETLMNQILQNALATRLILVLIAVRFTLTLLCYSTGAAGGIFTPLLILGGLTGLLFSHLADATGTVGFSEPGLCALVGMGALFCGSVRAPLTGMILLVEMTADYALILPLLTACLFAYGVTEWLRVPPLYDTLMNRDMKRDIP